MPTPISNTPEPILPSTTESPKSSPILPSVESSFDDLALFFADTPHLNAKVVPLNQCPEPVQQLAQKTESAVGVVLSSGITSRDISEVDQVANYFGSLKDAIHVHFKVEGDSCVATLMNSQAIVDKNNVGLLNHVNGGLVLTDELRAKIGHRLHNIRFEHDGSDQMKQILRKLGGVKINVIIVSKDLWDEIQRQITEKMIGSEDDAHKKDMEHVKLDKRLGREPRTKSEERDEELKKEAIRFGQIKRDGIESELAEVIVNDEIIRKKHQKERKEFEHEHDKIQIESQLKREEIKGEEIKKDAITKS